jgi:hypothetical protein
MDQYSSSSSSSSATMSSPSYRLSSSSSSFVALVAMRPLGIALPAPASLGFPLLPLATASCISCQSNPVKTLRGISYLLHQPTLRKHLPAPISLKDRDTGLALRYFFLFFSIYKNEGARRTVDGALELLSAQATVELADACFLIKLDNDRVFVVTEETGKGGRQRVFLHNRISTKYADEAHTWPGLTLLGPTGPLEDFFRLPMIDVGGGLSAREVGGMRKV